MLAQTFEFNFLRRNALDRGSLARALLGFGSRVAVSGEFVSTARGTFFRGVYDAAEPPSGGTSRTQLLGTQLRTTPHAVALLVAKPAYTNTETMKKRTRSGVSLLVVRSAEVQKTYRAWFLSISLAAVLLCSVPLFTAVGVTASTAAAAKGATSRHNNNWAVLVR